MKVLVVDDEEIKRISLADDLANTGFETVSAADGREALDLLARVSFDVVVTDIRMSNMDGMELLKHIKRGKGLHPEVIMMTAYGSIPLAVEAMKLGAYNFITKPFSNDEVVTLLERIKEKRQRTPEAEKKRATVDLSKLEQTLIGHSSAMQEVRRLVELYARNDATVLLTGQTGTGKDLVAKTIHDLSNRRSAAFVKVNCSTFPDHLIESALFGHAKGSFTGADQKRDGKFDLAQGGTIYLDDVDDIPLEHQIKLLRVIEEKIFERVGAAVPIHVNVRIIAATKKRLLAEAQNGTFRSDLYYRLNVLRISLPPLHTHLVDLPALVDHLLARIAHGRPYSLHKDAIQCLLCHTWPGNVRELLNTLERAFLLGNGRITPDLLAPELEPIHEDLTGSGRFNTALNRTEQELLYKALKQANGNKSEAARTLGMKLSTFRDKLKKHSL
ncbi:MAG: sigma-54 dependent transcriptional regulator [Phycisphaerae bacterium]|nr:sigma-54 dependent transcriptional regulator [Phycisphaerae bacterium]